jgi:hypothetical protein
MSLTSIESARFELRSGFTSAINGISKIAFFCVAVLVMSIWSHLAAAATINYPDPPMGNTVSYVGISETSLTDPVPLFGAPFVSGDSIDFNPTGFGAFASGGAVKGTDGQLGFMVVAKQGIGISNINFAEAGITTLAGIGTDNTYTDVSATGKVKILAIDGNTLNNVISIDISLTFAPNGNGTFRLVSDAGLGLSSLPWTGGQLINLDQALTANNIPFQLGATKISVDLDNGLVAQSEQGTFSLIDKKDFGGLAVTVNMPHGGGGPDTPEPTSLVLAFLGFVGVAAGRRYSR